MLPDAKRMHQTTVRFSPDLWRMLEAEAASCGVSVAHYVREAALARIAFSAGQRSAGADSFAWADRRGAAAAKVHSSDNVEAASALQAQARLATTRAADIRGRAEAARDRRARDGRT